MKRSIHVLGSAAIALIAGSLVACGGGTSKPPQTTQSMMIRFDPGTGEPRRVAKQLKFERYLLGPCLPGAPEGSKIDRGRVLAGMPTIHADIPERGAPGTGRPLPDDVRDPINPGDGPPLGDDDLISEKCLSDTTLPPPPTVTMEVCLKCNADYLVSWDPYWGATEYEVTIWPEGAARTGEPLFRQVVDETHVAVPTAAVKGSTDVVIVVVAILANGDRVPYKSADAVVVGV